MDSRYQLTVGLEVHIQLATQSKLFASDSTAFGQLPNSNLNAITLAHPGTMPKLNEKAIVYAVRMGLACESEISRFCIFDRKNYFYPDLPKGYQTTQDHSPICVGGQIEVRLKDGSQEMIHVNRIHLEEDAGKSIHDLDPDFTLIDLNRAGVPLIELVTEPCITSAEAAMAFLKEIRNTVRFLEICDGNMEEGSMRCDANISIRRVGDNDLGKKVEVKNMNSIRNVGRAIAHEYERQSRILDDGGEVISETRLFDAGTGITSGMRTKEELNDYRYFPEPDLSPFTITDKQLDEIAESMPATPKQLREKFTKVYGLSDYDADVLTSEKEIAMYFEQVCSHVSDYKEAANWVQGPIKSLMNEESASGQLAIEPSTVAELVRMIEAEKITNSLARKTIFPYIVEHNVNSVTSALEHLGIAGHNSSDLSQQIDEILNALPDKVVAYNKGKKNLLGLFMGELMKKTAGTADPKEAKKLLIEALEENA